MRLSKKLGKKVHRNKIVVVNALKMTYVNRGIVHARATALLRSIEIQPSKVSHGEVAPGHPLLGRGRFATMLLSQKDM